MGAPDRRRVRVDGPAAWGLLRPATLLRARDPRRRGKRLTWTDRDGSMTRRAVTLSAPLDRNPAPGSRIWSGAHSFKKRTPVHGHLDGASEARAGRPSDQDRLGRRGPPGARACRSDGAARGRARRPVDDRAPAAPPGHPG